MLMKRSGHRSPLRYYACLLMRGDELQVDSHKEPSRGLSYRSVAAVKG